MRCAINDLDRYKRPLLPAGDACARLPLPQCCPVSRRQHIPGPPGRLPSGCGCSRVRRVSGAPTGSLNFSRLCYLSARAPLLSRPTASQAGAVRLRDAPAPLRGLRSRGEPTVHPAAPVYGPVQALVPHGRGVAACPVPTLGAAPGTLSLRRGPPQAYLPAPDVIAGH
jgi:hypothetical protein